MQVRINDVFDSRNGATTQNLIANIIEQFSPVNFAEIVYPDCNGQLPKKIYKQHKLIAICDHLLHFSSQLGFGICLKNETTYLFNGMYWQPITRDETRFLLMNVAKRMGISKYEAEYFEFLDDLCNQFYVSAYSDEIKLDLTRLLINLANGTLEITSGEINPIRSFDRNDFLKYKLPFMYEPTAEAPIFMKFLTRVLPSKDSQMLLSEYLGYVFLKNNELKLEKVLMLLGGGHNGKSVFFDVIKALLGSNNISTFSPQTLMSRNEGAKHRAEIEDKLLNYASECGSEINSDMFKKMASGEPIDARPLYKRPYEIDNYAKLMFNANELPQAPEMTHAYFRRFIIVPFKIQIPLEERDVDLSKKIINNELSGVFNWVLGGLQQLLINRRFTISEECEEVLHNYQVNSDSTLLFIEAHKLGNPNASFTDVSLEVLYRKYKEFCELDGYKPLSKKKLSERLQLHGFEKSRSRDGVTFKVAYGKFIKFKK